MKPDSAIEIIRQLRRKGHDAYLVGGCVRDMVMKIEPSDYDIATSAPPDEIMRIFPHTEPIGAQFGVVLVILRGHPFEVATFRSDEAYVDGRRPTAVSFTDAKTDVLRRDFTINGLLYDPERQEVIDYVGGEADIRDRIVRAIGDPLKRFEEDKLRLLRAVRFGARLGYSIEPETWSAVRRMAPQIKRVSAERIRDELSRILTEGNAAVGFRMLHESGMLTEVLPPVLWTAHLERCLAFLPAKAAKDFAFAVLLHDAAPQHVRFIVDDLRMSGSEGQHVLNLIHGLPKFRSLPLEPVHAVKRFLRLSRFQDYLELARICESAGEGDLRGYNFALEKRAQWSSEELAPPPLISGNELISMGLTPGPLFREILTRVENEQLDGRLTTAQQALDFIATEYRT
ncbi:MAG TPA: CCA tRNA nucleotidyltransferase [Terriglobia bacterium]|nr:CCA tRNA nucleotidyltransferase [Terriglobia bacterium]